MTDSTTRDLVARYVGVWGEVDAEQRRSAIETLWVEDGIHILHPPEEIRTAAAGPGFEASTLEATGYDELEARVARGEVVGEGLEILLVSADNRILADYQFPNP